MYIFYMLLLFFSAFFLLLSVYYVSEYFFYKIKNRTRYVPLDLTTMQLLIRNEQLRYWPESKIPKTNLTFKDYVKYCIAILRNKEDLFPDHHTNMLYKELVQKEVTKMNSKKKH